MDSLLSASIIFVLNFVLKLLDEWLFLPLLGYSVRNGSKKEQEEAKKAGRTVQLVKIHASPVASYFTHMRKHVKLDLFLYTHQSYQEPDYILNHDHVTLFAITRDARHAIFCVTDEQEDVYDSIKHPFVYVGQAKLMERLVIVPIGELHRLAERLGDPQFQKVTLYATTGRVGSTLMSQMLSHVPDIHARSEPLYLLNVHRAYMDGEVTLPEYEQLVQSAVRLQLKGVHSTDIKHLMVKFSGMFKAGQLDVLKKFFPDFQYFILTRNFRSNLISHVKLFQASSSRLESLWPYNRLSLIKNAGLPLYDLKWWARYRNFAVKYQNGTVAELMAFLLAAGYQCFFTTKLDFLHIVYYEDLIKDPAAELTALFSKLGCSSQNLSKSLDVLKVDSQRGMIKTQVIKTEVISKEQWEIIDQMFQDLGQPFSSRMGLNEFKQVLQQRIRISG